MMESEFSNMMYLQDIDALCTKAINAEEYELMAQINKPDEYFNTVLYTGNGSTQSITGVNFQPDWVWIKNRSSVTNHEVADVVRGANKLLKPNDVDAEQSISTKITSFDSDGFGIGSDANVNGSGNSLVAWNWLADNTSGSSNTDGSITSNSFS
jgi:hypothetical protein